MPGSLELLGEAYEVMRQAVIALPADEWETSARIEGFTAAGLVGHVVSAVEQFTGLVQGRAFDPSDSSHVAHGAAGALWVEATAQSLAAWGSDGAIDRSYALPRGEETGERLIAYLIIEVIGHAWDFCGNDLEISNDVAQKALAVAESFAPETLRAPGMFGPEVATDEQASPLWKLVAFLGRDPLQG